MTHHSRYHATRTDRLHTLQSDPEREELEDLTDCSVEEEQEEMFARLLGYEPETI